MAVVPCSQLNSACWLISFSTANPSIFPLLQSLLYKAGFLPLLPLISSQEMISATLGPFNNTLYHTALWDNQTKDLVLISQCIGSGSIFTSAYNQRESTGPKAWYLYGMVLIQPQLPEFLSTSQSLMYLTSQHPMRQDSSVTHNS